MDLQLSDPFDAFERIRQSITRSDWTAAQLIAGTLERQPLPHSAEYLARYLAGLKQALVTAKTARANAIASLARLNAAAEFQDPASRPSPRHNSAVSAIF